MLPVHKYESLEDYRAALLKASGIKYPDWSWYGHTLAMWDCRYLSQAVELIKNNLKRQKR